MQPDPRRAIVDRREQIASEPRPSPLGEEFIGQPSDQAEADDIFRLYRPEWVVVHTESAAFGDDREALVAQAVTQFDAHFAGRVRDEDVRYQSSGSGVNAVCQLLLRLPNLKGEFKHAFLAERHAEGCGYTQFAIVARNSKADHDLRAYGVVKLAKESA